jgi:hypothetical protein
MSFKVPFKKQFKKLLKSHASMGKHDQVKRYKMEAMQLFMQMKAQKQIERVIKAFE